jgi:hypothetical protein
MELITILNRCHRFRGFVDQHAHFTADKNADQHGFKETLTSQRPIEDARRGIFAGYRAWRYQPLFKCLPVTYEVGLNWIRIWFLDSGLSTRPNEQNRSGARPKACDLNAAIRIKQTWLA